MTLPSLASSRLEYRRLSPAEIEPFHTLVVDEHVRRYLLDGQAMDRPWCEAQLAASDALFAEHGVGLWLAYRYGQPERPIGFCGFIRFDETGPDPQLLYALLAEHAGQGLATEMGAALVEYVRQLDPRREIISAVDEPNAASVRVLEKLGFERTGESPGAFGRIWHYWLKSNTPPLCGELQTLLDAELAAGNCVVDFGRDFPRPGYLLVRLAKRFRAVPAQLPAGVVLREVNDPHWWQAEYVHTASGQYLVCGFE